jgi:hypothetical protein
MTTPNRELAAPLRAVQGKLDRLAAKTYREPTPWLPGQKYLYAYGFKEVRNFRRQLVTKLYCDGPFTDKREAERKLIELKLDQGDIYESDSRDRNKVTKEIAAKLAHDHKLPVEVATQRKFRK